MPDDLIIPTRLAGALTAGGILGLERNYHGRAAGFRTHALVCLASCLLMLMAVGQSNWLPATTAVVVLDPVRMAQGIMTGIGFLGAGVIYKEDFGIRGLTTAAAIWISAAIGILIWVGYIVPAVLAVLLSLCTLSVFRRVETHLPAQAFAHCDIAFDRDDAMQEEAVHDLLREHGFIAVKTGYVIDPDKNFFTLQMVIQTMEPDNAANLAQALRRMPRVRGVKMSAAGN